MFPKIFSHVALSLQKKTCCKIKIRGLILPLVFICMLGFAINHSTTRFTYQAIQFCQPKTNIVFLKTHKCASSTIQNILMRYGDYHNLTFVLPREANYLGKGQLFKPQFVDRPRFPVYNIFTHHTRLDYDAIKKFMPPDAVFITIVRNPLQVFESSYVYYNLHNLYGLDIQKFAKFAPMLNYTFFNQRLAHKIGVNQMLYDLGADPQIFRNDSLVEHFVDNLDSQFHLILVSERMDESLVLLKNFLCWTVDDVIAFKVNARNPKFKSNLTDDQLKNLEHIHRADMILYNRFLNRFEDQVKSFGESRMQQELSELRYKRKLWSEFCVQKVQAKSKTGSKGTYYNPYIMEFELRAGVHNATCESLIMEELPYTEHLRKKQKSRLPKIYPKKQLARKPKLNQKVRRRSQYSIKHKLSSKVS